MMYVGKKNPSGAYPGPQSNYVKGMTPLTDEQVQVLIQYNGFVDITTDEEGVVTVTPNEEAWEEWKASLPEPEPEPVDLTSQYQAAMRAFAATSVVIPDTYALEMPDLFLTWEEVLVKARNREAYTLQAGQIINDGGQLYSVVQNVTPIESQAPHDEGMLTIYRPIEPGHEGTLEDPIPWVYGMDCYAGKYYSYNDKVYRVAEGGDMIPCVWEPGTEGLWQWEEVTE